MASGRSISIRLTLEEAEKVRAELRNIGSQGESALTALERGSARAAAGADKAASSFSQLGVAQGALGNLASRAGIAGTALGGLGAAGLAAGATLGSLAVGVTAVAKAGDDMVASLGRIRAATGSIEAARDVYEQLYKLSLQTGQSVSDSAGQFARFAIATKEVGATNTQALALVETLQKAAIVGGASGQEAAAGALQLGQALASGVLQGDELRSLLEAMPNLAVGLARELGVGLGELRKMGSEGKLTADVVLPALLRAGEAINAEYAKMPVTMSRAFEQVTVAAGGFAAQLDQSLSISQNISRALQEAARIFNQLRGAVTAASASDIAAATSAGRASMSQRLQNQLAGVDQQIATTAAEVGANADRDPVLAQLRQQRAQIATLLDDQNKLYRASETERLAILRDGREDAAAEQADAAAKRLENQRQQNAKLLEALRIDQDKQYAAQQAWSKRVAEINALIDKPGGVSAAEGQRLIALATTERDEALKKLDGTAKREAEARAAESKARREALQAEKEAAADALKIYDQLRVSSRSELLLGTDGDARTEQAILTKIRGSALDPEVQKRAQDKIERDQKDFLREQERDIKASTNSIVDYSADRFADLFDKNGAGWAGMLETFESTAKSTFARIAAEAIIRPIVTPIVGSVLGGATSVAGAAGSTTPAGAIAGTGGISTMDAAKLIGKTFTGGENGYRTGFSSIDGFANSEAYTGFGGSSVTYGQAATGALGVAGGIYGLYTAGQTGGAKGWAQGVGGAASVAGGAAALAGGAGASAALGAIATVAPYVAVAALIASYFLSGQKPSDMTGVYRGNLQTGVNDVTGLDGDRFSQENRDLAANLGQSITDLSTSLRGALGVAQTPFNFEIAAGARDGLVASYGGRERDYANDEAGAKQLIVEMTAAMIDSMKGLASAEVQSVVNASGGNVETTLGNLDFYNGVYRSFVEGADPEKVASYTAAVKAQSDQYASIATKAADLGLSLEPISSALTKQLEAMNKARVTAFDASISSMNQQATSLRGGNQLGPMLAAFDRQRTMDWEALVKQIWDQGFDQNQVNDAWNAFIPLKQLERQSIIDQDQAARVSSRNTLLDQLEAANGTADTEAGALAAFERRAQVQRLAAAKDGVTDAVLLEQTLAEQRLAIQRSFAEQAKAIEDQRLSASLSAELQGLQALQSQSATLRGFLDSQAVSGAGVSPQNAFLAAQSQYQDAVSAARSGGDLGAYATAANTLLSANSSYNATGAEASAVRDAVLATTRDLGATLNLPGFTSNIEAGFARVMDPKNTGIGALRNSNDELRSEINELREELRTMRLRSYA